MLGGRVKTQTGERKQRAQSRARALKFAAPEKRRNCDEKINTPQHSTVQHCTAQQKGDQTIVFGITERTTESEETDQISLQH